MKNISFAPVRALYMSYDDEWTREHPERVWDEAVKDALLAIGPANLSEEQLDSLSESDAFHLIHFSDVRGKRKGFQLLDEGREQFDFSSDHGYRDYLKKLVGDGIFPKSDLPATTAGTLMVILRGKAERERETRTDLDNTMAFAMKAGIMSARGISRMTGLSHVTVARRANEADDAVVNDLVSTYHFYAAEEGEYAVPDESIHASNSEHDDLDPLAEMDEHGQEQLNHIKSLVEEKHRIEAEIRESALAAYGNRFISVQSIADAAQVTRTTIFRWGKKEGK